MPDPSQDLRNKILGRKGEVMTVSYLKQRGYRILKRNFRTPFGEADILAKQGDTYCLVEVKTRISDAFGLPSEAVNAKKRERYRKMALFLCERLGEEVPCRFDVSSVTEDIAREGTLGGTYPAYAFLYGNRALRTFPAAHGRRVLRRVCVASTVITARLYA